MPKSKKGKTLKLVKDKKNYRLHPDRNKEMIRMSLNEVGGGRSILADADGIVRAGNGVFEQATELGMEFVPVEIKKNQILVAVRPDLKGKAAERMGLLDNATQESSAWDYQRLGDLAKREKEMLAGIKTDAEINAIIRRAEADALASVNGMSNEAVEEHDENIKKYAKKWPVKDGDIWKAGEHLIICTDCSYDWWLDVVGLASVQAVFTSPPYADQREETYGGVEASKYVEWFHTIQGRIGSALKKDGSFLLNIKPHCEDGERSLYVMDLVLHLCRTCGWKFIDELSWVKTPFPGDFKTRFKNAFEPVYHFSPSTSPKVYRENVATYSETAFTADGRKMSTGSGKGYIRGSVTGPGLVYPSNVVEATAGKIGGHAAAFPISLADFFVQAYSAEGDKVLDPFAGSGTVLISCERNNRKGIAIEKKPEYVSFILERLSWEELQPVKVQEGSNDRKKKAVRSR